MDDETDTMFSFSVEQSDDEHAATQFILDKLSSKNNRVVYETVLKVSYSLYYNCFCHIQFAPVSK